MRVTIIVHPRFTHVHWRASRGTVGAYLRRPAVANRLMCNYPVFIRETVRLTDAEETEKSSVIFGVLGACDLWR
jgi:hypothetical protein